MPRGTARRHIETLLPTGGPTEYTQAITATCTTSAVWTRAAIAFTRTVSATSTPSAVMTRSRVVLRTIEATVTAGVSIAKRITKAAMSVVTVTSARLAGPPPEVLPIEGDGSVGSSVESRETVIYREPE